VATSAVNSCWLGVEARPLGSGQTSGMDLNFNIFFPSWFINFFFFLVYMLISLQAVEPAFFLSIEYKQRPGFLLILHPKVCE
jgi:hypothetical protein